MWMNSAALKAVKQKCKAWMKYKATRQMSNFVAYSRRRNLSTTAVRDAKYMFERNLASKANRRKYVSSCIQKYDQMLVHLSMAMDHLLNLIMKPLMV